MTARPGCPRTVPLTHMPKGWSERRWQRRFWCIFSGQAVSLVGSSMTQFVLLWWITDATGSLAALSAAGMAALLPQAVLGPLGGTLADRYSRRLLMISADTLSALCMLVLITLFVTERIELWHAYTMMALRSAMQAFQAPAASASVAMLVPRSFVVRAAGLNQSLQGLAVVAAAPLGALTLGAMPMAWALSIDVFATLLGIVPLLCFLIPQPSERHVHREGLWGEFRESLHLVWRTPGLRQLYLLLGLLVFAVMPTIVLLPMVVDVHHGGGTIQVARIEGLAGGVMLLGCMLMAASIDPRRLAHWAMVGAATSCAWISLTAMRPASLFGAALAWWAMSFIRFALGNAPMTAFLQATVPPQFQGRLLALMMSIAALAAAVGVALAPPLREWIGVRGVFALAAAASALASLVGILFPSLLAMNAWTNMRVHARY